MENTHVCGQNRLEWHHVMHCNGSSATGFLKITTLVHGWRARHRNPHSQFLQTFSRFYIQNFYMFRILFDLEKTCHCYFIKYISSLCLFPGIYKQPLEPTMTLRVQTSTHRACLLCVTWRLARVNPFHQTHLSQRPGGYRTQVCCSYWLNQTESTAETRLVSKAAPAPVVLTPDLSLWLSGAESWPPGVCLKYVGGDQFGHVNMVMVRSLDPQEMTDVSVQMQSPTSPGMYQGQWRMCTATGLYYGGTFHPWYLTCFLFFFVSPLKMM